MPRNEAKPLSETEYRYQTKVKNALAPTADYRDVLVRYSKRDGTKSEAVGRVKFFSGKPGFDTGSVTIETRDRGNRTINLHRIYYIE